MRRSENALLMSVQGQKHELPRRSIAVRFAPNKQTPDRRGFYDAMCQKLTHALQQSILYSIPRQRWRAAVSLLQHVALLLEHAVREIMEGHQPAVR